MKTFRVNFRWRVPRIILAYFIPHTFGTFDILLYVHTLYSNNQGETEIQEIQNSQFKRFHGKGKESELR